MWGCAEAGLPQGTLAPLSGSLASAFPLGGSSQIVTVCIFSQVCACVCVCFPPALHTVKGEIGLDLPPKFSPGISTVFTLECADMLLGWPGSNKWIAE